MDNNQKTVLKNWCKQQGNLSSVTLREKLNHKAITHYHEWDETRPREAILVQTEKLLKHIATEYGITLATTPSQINQIFLTAYQTAGTQAQKDKALDDKHMFWICFVNLRTVNVSGGDNEIVSHKDPDQWAQSPAEEMDLPANLNSDDIEDAQRNG